MYTSSRPCHYQVRVAQTPTFRNWFYIYIKLFLSLHTCLCIFIEIKGKALCAGSFMGRWCVEGGSPWSRQRTGSCYRLKSKSVQDPLRSCTSHFAITLYTTIILDATLTLKPQYQYFYYVDRKLNEVKIITIFVLFCFPPSHLLQCILKTSQPKSHQYN